MFSGFPNSQRLKNRWKEFHRAFTFDLTEFEKKNAIPTFQEDMQELIRLLENITFLQNHFSEEEWEGITDFINRLRNHYNGGSPNNLLDLERYVEKMKEHCSQVKYLIDKIHTTANHTILDGPRRYQIHNIQSLEERIRRNIDEWYKQRSKLNSQIFSILLEERKICYANRILLLEILAVITGILFAIKIF